MQSQLDFWQATTGFNHREQTQTQGRKQGRHGGRTSLIVDFGLLIENLKTQRSSINNQKSEI
jgi:hypothetical protein